MHRILLIITMALSLNYQTLKAQSYNFVPDTNLRLDSAAIAHATMVNDTLFLFYNLKLFTGFSSSAVAIATQSSDWLSLDTTVSYFDFEHYFIRYLMPDGVTYRRYFPDSTGRNLNSKSLTSGTTFAEDTGVRYTLQSEDSVIGVNTFFTDSDGRTHMLYNTTDQPRSQCRHAVSPPGSNGLNFQFASRNPFGDYGRDNPYAFVDPNAIQNPDGSTTIFLMNQHGTVQSVDRRTGHIHSFTTTDYVKFNKDSLGNDTTLLDYHDFDSESVASYGGAMVHSLNDPKCVILRDGRYRIYSTALLRTGTDTTRWGIVSYTRPGPYVMGIEGQEAEVKVSNKAFYHSDRLFIDNRTGVSSYVIYNMKGELVKNGDVGFSGMNAIALSLSVGTYVVVLDDGEGGSEKIVVR